MTRLFKVHHRYDSDEHHNGGIRKQGFGIGIDRLGVESERAAGYLEVKDDRFYDLAAGKSDNGKVVALETQHRQTDRKADGCGGKSPYYHGERQADVKRQGHGGYRKQAAGEKSHRHKAGMTERQLAEKSHNEIERHRKHDVAGHRHEHCRKLARR